jgi:folate-binding protein YgfZ
MSNAEVELEAEGYACLRESAGWRMLARDVVTVTGPDAATFLQGQLTQDVASLTPGCSVWSLILAPAGRVDALVRVWRVDAETFALDTDGGWGDAVAARLARFRLRTKADIAQVDWPVIGVRGPGAADAVGATPALDASWPGLAGVDFVGPDVSPPLGIIEVGPGAWEATRIEAGIPQMGSELTERTIPAEAGIVERTVSFTKGCFTGQELVARIDSRGSKVPRNLRGLRSAQPLEVGAVLTDQGKEVCWVTSVARSPALGWVALGYVARAVEVPASLDAGEFVVQVGALPLVS